ncbi:MAG: amidohydrolase [Pseudomonadota bacterium]
MGNAVAADLVIHGGKVTTLAAAQPAAQAVAVWRGRILAVGSDDEMMALAGPATRRIDLAGRRVVPGIVDSHCHPDSHALTLLRWVDIGWPAVKSVGELLQLVATRTAALAPGQPLLGFGYNDQKCGGYPTREQLDAVSNGRPVWLYRTDHHIAVLNSAMLQTMGVDDNAEDPPHGRFDRDPATGRMTGLLREMAAWGLEERIKESYSVAEYEAGLPRVFDLYLRHGVTSLHNSLTARKAIEAYQRLREAGKLSMRIGVILDGRDEALVDSYLAAGVRTGFGDEWIRIIGVEWCPDCSTSGRTAAYYDPYVGRAVPGEPVPNCGMLLYDAEELIPKVIAAHKAGLRVCVEGIGDRGIDFALDAIEAALEAHPRPDHRSRVEHCCYVTPKILERIKRLGAVDSSATGFMWSLGDAYIDNRGEAAMRWMWPHRTLIDAGVPAPGHSDAPICSTNPWEIIGAMVMRRTDTGRPIGAPEAVTVEEALRAYTILGAWAGFEEELKGAIEPGKLADFAVLEQDVFTVPPEAVKDTKVAMTFVGGEIAYQA